uniref:Uncharacterized protein n=1 Tax=Arundo donax TaxID=35708 RepID=A0A0A9C0Z8_ARUDO
MESAATAPLRSLGALEAVATASEGCFSIRSTCLRR